MSTKEVAKQTVQLVEQGSYRTSSGQQVSIEKEVAYAKENTVLFTPDDLDELIRERIVLSRAVSGSTVCQFEVTTETTAQAAQRLVEINQLNDVLALNFASARNPGGGFLNGAKAQEEDLARASALYHCQLTQMRYYTANRMCSSLLYTHHAIYSPSVPFFRDSEGVLLGKPFLVSIITSPAPNAGEVQRKSKSDMRDLSDTFIERARMVLDIAAIKGHRTLVLGAWGCGVFRNSAENVAKMFRELLTSSEYRGLFSYVVFAIAERGKVKDKYQAFHREFRPLL